MLVLALLSTFLMAQQKPKVQIQEIRATGCVRRAVESQCLVLETLDGSTTYTYVAAAPKPELNAVITLLGKSHPGRSACKQGIPIDVTDWEPTGEKCALPPKK
jgi:hypothetical protein